MPILNSVGYGEYSSIKMEIFTSILNQLVSIYIKTLSFLTPCLHFYDLTAGTGKNPLGFRGSPFIFIETLETHKIKRYALTLFEQDKGNMVQLRKNICRVSSIENNDIQKKDLLPYIPIRKFLLPHKPIVNFRETDHHEILDFHFDSVFFGTLFYDLSGGIPDFDFLRSLSHILPEIDFILYVSTTNYKRVRLQKPDKPRILFDVGLKRIEKKFWMISEPLGAHGWTFFVGTNNSHCLKSLCSVSGVLADADSYQGKIWLNTATCTKEETTKIKEETVKDLVKELVKETVVQEKLMEGTVGIKDKLKQLNNLDYRSSLEYLKDAEPRPRQKYIPVKLRGSTIVDGQSPRKYRRISVEERQRQQKEREREQKIREREQKIKERIRKKGIEEFKNECLETAFTGFKNCDKKDVKTLLLWVSLAKEALSVDIREQINETLS